MTDAPDLATWLRAQLDEDERVARAMRQAAWPEYVAVTPSLYLSDDEPDGAVHVSHQGSDAYAVVINPVQAEAAGLADNFDMTGRGPVSTATEVWGRQEAERRLTEIEADRKLIAAYERAEADLIYGDPHEEGQHTGLELALKIRAESYAGRPGWRDEWKPQ